MPPRSSLTSSFSLTDINNEVVCPLRNQDGSNCRKRCLGEKRYRSMQEHIRRAHPEYYTPKLPATRESFELMISSPPHERPPPPDPLSNSSPTTNTQQQQQQHHPHHPHPALSHQLADASGLSPAFTFDPGLNSSYEGYPALGQHDGGYYTAGDAEAAAIYSSMQAQQRSSDDYRRGSLIPAASAAQALAQLHYHRPDWDVADAGHDISQVIFPSLQMSPTLTEADFLQNFYADQHDADMKPNHLHNHHSFNVDPALEDSAFMHDGASAFPIGSSSGADLPSSLGRSSPPSGMLPSLQHSLSRSHHSRPRKSSLTQQARLPKHERRRSRELAKRSSGGDRKAWTAEPSAATLYGKRWEDLIDAAASATEEEGSRDLTPIPASPYQSPPPAISRTSLPPFALGSQFQSFQASPLNRALTPPPPDPGLDGLQAFPSVDSSLSSSLSHHHLHHHSHHASADSSGSQFHIMDPATLDATGHDSSPLFGSTAPTTSSMTALALAQQQHHSSSPPTNPHPQSQHQHSQSQPHAQPNHQPDNLNSGGSSSTSNSTVQIYCAGCRRLSVLKDAFACTSCICGLCADCVQAIVEGQARGRLSMCPRCSGMGGEFKSFQLDLR